MLPNKVYTSFLISFLLAIQITFANVTPVSSQPQLSGNVADLDSFLRGLDYSKIEEHVLALSTHNSRITGYPGAEWAADYIVNKFNLYNLEVMRQNYSVPVPIDYGSKIYVLGEGNEVAKVLNAHAVWPNFIQTSKTDGTEGPLIYVGKGELWDFNGKVVNGSIVLMDFNSDNNWLNAVQFGAQAVIFIAPEETTYTEASKKFLNTPAHFPRIYVSLEDGYLLRGMVSSGVRVRVSVDMLYENVVAENVIGVVHGDLYPNDIIVVATHYDTWSAVPALAPGADEATSTAVLLEMARYFSVNHPKRTLWFVALSGHYQAIAGGREFVERYFFDADIVNGTKKMWAFFNLDFSTDGRSVALLYGGHLYEYYSLAIGNRYTRWLEPRITQVYLPSLKQLTARDYKVEIAFFGDFGWWASIPGPFMLDSEPFAAAHGLGFSIRTNDVAREGRGHPLDTADKVNYENLKPQVEVASSIAHGLASEDTIGMDWSSLVPSRYLWLAAGADVAGFITVKGTVLNFDVASSWYRPKPGFIVVARRIDPTYSMYPFVTLLTMSDENGEFEFHGLTGMGYGHGYGRVDYWHVIAFHLNKETGLIDYAPDSGQYGSRQISFQYLLDRSPYFVSTVVFKSSSISLFGIADPFTLQPLLFIDPRFDNSGVPAITRWAGGAGVSGISHIWSTKPYAFGVLDYSSLSEYIFWGYYSVGYEDVAVVFVPPETRFMLTYKVGSKLSLAGVLLNATTENPEGNGILIKEGEELRIVSLPLQMVKDTLTVTKGRYTQLRNSYIISAVSDKAIDEAETHLMNANHALENLDYDRSNAEVLSSWSWTARAYSDTMQLIGDVMTVNLMFFVLFSFFSVLMGAMIGSLKGKSNLVAIAIIFAALLSVYFFVHPSPKVAKNFALSPLSVIVFLLYIMVFSTFATKAVGYVREARRKTIGAHYAERSILSMTSVLMTYGLQNMKRRKLLTTTSLITVIVVTFGIMSLTSVVPYFGLSYAPTPLGNPVYNGLLTKQVLQSAPGNMFDPKILDVLKYYVGDKGIICPRIWSYPVSHRGSEVYGEVYSTNEGRTFRVKGILGLSPGEFSLMEYGSALSGRWFVEEREYSTIISEEAAKALNVQIGDRVRIGSLNLMVIGIYKSVVLNQFVDIDNYPITPVEPNSVALLLAGQVLEESRVHMSWDEIIVVPHGVALDLGGYISSIAIRMEDTQFLQEVAKKLAQTLENTFFYMSFDEKVWSPSAMVFFGFLGWGMMTIPIIIGVTVVLNNLLGAMKERTREIGVYSAVGLSPRGVALIFLAEISLYACTGGVVGYLTGILGNIVFYEAGLLPKDFIINTSSLSTMLAVALSIAFTLVAAIYPSSVSSKIVTPSLERKWKLPTKPREGEWEIPLPFNVPTQEEAIRILRFLYEYKQVHTVESTEPFIVREVRLLPEKVTLLSRVALQPVEVGVTQDIEIKGTVTEEKLIGFSILITHLTGPRDIWQSNNYRVVDALRKQFLIWAGLPPSEKERYRGN